MRLLLNWKRATALLSALVIASTMIAWPQSASAAGGFNLTLSPLPISLKAKPGETITTPLSVQNTGSEAVRLKVSLMKFGANGTAGEPSIEDPAPNDEFIKWVKFSKTTFVAEPGVLNTITMTIKIPQDAGFGYYYAATFNQDSGDQPKVKNQNAVSGAVASLILLDVDAPGSKRELQVTSFATTQKIYQYLPATFTVKVKNSGNVHAVPRGNIFVGRSGSSDFLGTLSINKEQGNVLPNSSRVFTVAWKDGFPSYEIKRQNGQIVSDKEGQPVEELKWDLGNANKLRFGKYTASMTLVYDNGTQDVPINGVVSFWVIPWIPLLILLGILVFVGLGVFFIVRSFYKRIKKVGKKPKKSKESTE